MPMITKIYSSGFGGAGTMHLIVGNAFKSLCFQETIMSGDAQ